VCDLRADMIGFGQSKHKKPNSPNGVR
jgi:hypothetical protein